MCWHCCLSESDSTVELCCYRLHRFTCSAAVRLKDKGGVASRRGGGWVTYHLMLPLLHNPTLSNGGKLLMKPQSRTMEDGKRKGERGEEKEERPALFFGVSMQTPDKASLPFFTKFVFFPGSRFDRLSILMESCDAPKLCLNPSRNSQQLRLLLICNFCRAPVEKPKGYELLSHPCCTGKLVASPLSN